MIAIQLTASDIIALHVPRNDLDYISSIILAFWACITLLQDFKLQQAFVPIIIGPSIF